MTVEATDKMSADVAKNPDGRVKLADIEAAIAFEFTRTGAEIIHSPPFNVEPTGEIKAREFFLTPKNAALLSNAGTMTVCMLILHNGFIVIGKSAPLDPANFNAELGAKFARDDAIRQVWPLMAFSRLDAALSAG